MKPLPLILCVFLASTIALFSVAAEPAEPTLPEMLKAVETGLRIWQTDKAAEIMDGILKFFPATPEARTLSDLIHIARDANPAAKKPAITECTPKDAHALALLFANFSRTVRAYSSLPKDKQAALASVFGPATFSNPDVSLNGLLRFLQHFQSLQQSVRMRPQ